MKYGICGKEKLKDSQCINYKYYHNDCIENLQQENQQLKIQISAREEVANKYKEVIDEVREYIEDWLFDAGGNGASMTYEDINELLQILDKGESNE